MKTITMELALTPEERDTLITLLTHACRDIEDDLDVTPANEHDYLSQTSAFFLSNACRLLNGLRKKIVTANPG